MSPRCVPELPRLPASQGHAPLPRAGTSHVGRPRRLSAGSRVSLLAASPAATRRRPHLGSQAAR